MVHTPMHFIRLCLLSVGYCQRCGDLDLRIHHSLVKKNYDGGSFGSALRCIQALPHEVYDLIRRTRCLEQIERRTGRFQIVWSEL